MTDSRLQQIAADAAGRGWQVEWFNNNHRTEVLVTPRINSEIHERIFGLGFGVALGGEHITCWIWETWGGSLIKPEICFDQIPADREVAIFPVVTSLQQALPIFDRAVTNYINWQRHPRTNPWWDKSTLDQWPLVDLLAEEEVA